MILIDVSSILHRMIFGSTNEANKIRKENGKYITKDFISLTLHLIISEIIAMQIKHNQYGEIVLCFDDYKKAYWRRDFYPDYKLSRRVSADKDESPINYKEVYEYVNELFRQLQENTPWKCIYVNRAEADDIILILAKEFYQAGILILSPDKDFLQSQRLPGIKQYSALTKKWLVPENKHNDMAHWIGEHCMLGDAADGVPKVIDHTEFSEAFAKHLNKYNKPTDVKTFKTLDIQEKREVLETFDEKTYNKKGQETGYDIYKQNRFGGSDLAKILDGSWNKKCKENTLKDKNRELTLQKKTASKEEKKALNEEIKANRELIKSIECTKTSQECLDEFLDSHPLYREHYERNFTLVMEEGIPDYIRANIMLEYNTAKTDYNEDLFMEYLDEMNLGTIKSKLPMVFKPQQTLDETNHGWDW